MVPAATRRYTVTTFFDRCGGRVGSLIFDRWFHHGSKWITVSAAVRFKPDPPALRLIRNTGSWDRSESERCARAIYRAAVEVLVTHLSSSSAFATSFSIETNWLK